MWPFMTRRGSHAQSPGTTVCRIVTRRSPPLPPVPAATIRIARAAFPRGYPYLHTADALGEVFSDDTFAALCRRRAHPALAP